MTYPFHHQVQEFFPDFDYRKCVGDRNIICRMDSGGGNKVGHQQRAFSVWWALKQCSPVDMGLDLGSPKGHTPYCVHVDIFGGGASHPFYGGGAYKSDIVWDAAKIHEIVPADSVPFINSNHSLEHMPGDGGDGGIVELLKRWTSLLRSGGILAMIIPDNAWFDVMGSDKDHKHAWSHSDFRPRVLDRLLAEGQVELLEYDTLDNHFSFDVVLKKK